MKCYSSSEKQDESSRISQKTGHVQKLVKVLLLHLPGTKEQEETMAEFCFLIRK